MPAKPKDPCKANACKIQSCLERNHFQESCCLDVLEEMRQCCVKWHKESICCSGINLEKVYVPNRESKKDADCQKPKSKNIISQLFKHHLLKWKLF